MHVAIDRGLDLELGPAPGYESVERVSAGRVAVQPGDFRGFVAKPLVSVGDVVARGQPLLADRRHPETVCTSFVSGQVVSIEHGPRRVLQRIVLRPEGDREREFPHHDRRRARALPADVVRELLLASGLWTAIRTRPFDRVPKPGSVPRAIFVTAIDTESLAPDPARLLDGRRDDFATGVQALSGLASGATWVCVARNAAIDVPDAANIRRAEFTGPHPVGLPGTHIHAAGVSVGRDADLWHIGYQDVAALGRLLTQGRLDGRRVLSLAGFGVERPRLISAVPGSDASAFDVPTASLGKRVLAGPPTLGRPLGAYLGRFDRQVTVLAAARRGRGLERRVLRRLAGEEPRGSRSGGMLPVETFDRVWPYRTPPALLLRALLIGDPDDAARLGCLGLAEDDLALLSLVCPAGIDYGSALRQTLEMIEAQEAA